MVEDDCADNGIPLPNVTSKILAKVIEYCRKHVEAAKPEERPAIDEDLKAWDAEFVKVDQIAVFDLILAANYLNIKSLLDLTCQTVAIITDPQLMGQTSLFRLNHSLPNWRSTSITRLRHRRRSAELEGAGLVDHVFGALRSQAGTDQDHVTRR
ncbi:hypothetical protein EV1_043091 [Malus domestica]